MTHLSRNLKELREHIGLSETIVADFLGVTHTTVSDYELGKIMPPHAHLKQLATLYDVEMADLFEDNAIDQRLNAAFAFRADSLTAKDLIGITHFKKIVKNYLNLVRVNESF
jgi:transcriptional regulator with XRE-family HTH domain